MNESQSTEVEFKDWFREQLESRSLTGAEFAENANISKAAAYFYLSGKRVPDEQSAALIARALEIAPESLPTFQRRKAGRRMAN